MYELLFIKIECNVLFFKDTMDEPQLGVYATYTYIILMVVSAIIIIFYASLTIQTRYITILSPSLSTFETLQKTYSETLNCPCSEPGVPHENMFVFPDPVYHPVKMILLKSL